MMIETTYLQAKRQELTALHKFADKYQAKGYNVLIKPDYRQLPEFLSDFEPDLLAEKDNDHIVIEVKSRQSLRYSEKMRRLADTVMRRPGWRFELLLTDTPATEESIPHALEKGELNGYIAELDKLLQEGMQLSAFMLVCITLEASMRYVAKQYELPADTPSLRLSKELTHNGILSQEQFGFIEQAMEFHNSLAHGFRVDFISDEWLQELRKMIDEVLHEADYVETEQA
ncbi:MAG: hypothetical protein GY862_39365 [Gammaproteobacteria bacterium]|nr:hypothetical protein [Gammaproteobacteria bacterium]